MSDALHLVAVKPLPPQLVQLDCDNFTILVLRVGPTSAIATTCMQFELGLGTEPEFGQLVIPLRRDEVEELDLLFDMEAGAEVHAQLVNLIREKIEEARRQHEQYHLTNGLFGNQATATA